MNISQMAAAAYVNSYSKGFHDHESVPPDDKTIAEKLALIHSEVSEALEEVREGRLETTTTMEGKPEGFFPELADILIRVGDLAGSFSGGAELLEASVKEKMAYNATRPRMHGKKF